MSFIKRNTYKSAEKRFHILPSLSLSWYDAPWWRPDIVCTWLAWEVNILTGSNL